MPRSILLLTFPLTLAAQSFLPSLNRFAGTDTSTLVGDGGPAYYSTLSRPPGIARDSAGNLYISETGRIRKIDPAGNISTIAGNGAPERKGDGGPATAAQVFYPEGLALDSKGNIYFTEDQFYLRHISPDGTISTIATPVQLSPLALALDTQGQLYIADSGNHMVRVIRNDGNLYTLAGTGASGTAGEGGPATKAQLLLPTGLAFDSAGNLYVADTRRIVKIDSNGVLTRIAGDPSLPLSGSDVDEVPALTTAVNAVSIAVDPSGVIYTGTPRVRKITPDGIIHAITLPKDLTAPFTEACGVALNATVYAAALLIDPSGNIDIADSLWNRVQQITPAGNISSLAGAGPNQFTGDGGPAINATFAAPSAIAFDASGNLFVADTNNNRVRKIDTSGNVQTVAGDGGPSYNVDASCVPDQDSFLSRPRGLAFDNAGNLLIADTGKNRIRKIAPDGTQSTVLSTPSPVGIAVDPSGNLRVADQAHATGTMVFDAAGTLYSPISHEVDRLATDGSLSPVAGTGEFNTSFAPGFANIPVEIGNASAVALDTSGTIYVADSIKAVIQRVNPFCTLDIAGAAGLSQPSGLAFDSHGALYITDAARGLIYRTTPAAPAAGTPPTPTFGYNGVASAANVPLIQPLGQPPLPAYAAPIAPGELVRLRGVCLGPIAPVNLPFDATGKLPTTAAGVSITANNIPVPLVSLSSGQILAVAPFGLDGSSSSTWTLTYNGAATTRLVTIDTASPATFVILNQDGSLNSPTNPAATGAQAALFSTGLGQTNPPGIDGLIAQPPFPQSKLPVSVTVAGRAASVLYAGPAPGFVGLSQIDFVIPSGTPPGQRALPVTLAAGTFTSRQTNITLWIAP